MPSPFRSASVTAPGSRMPCDRSARVAARGTAGLDRDDVVALLGKCEGLLTVRAEGHGQGDLLVDVAGRCEVSRPVAQQHEHVAVAVSDEQVGMAVQVSDAQAGRVWAHAVGRRLGETAAAVAEVDAHTVRPEQGEVTDAVAVEVGGDDGRGRRGREEPPGIGEAPPPSPSRTANEFEPGSMTAMSVWPPW